MAHSRDLVVRDPVRPLIHHFLKRALGYQCVYNLTIKSGGIPLQRSEGDVALGFGALGIGNRSLRNTHGARQLTSGHTQGLTHGAQPATGRPQARHGTPRSECLVELLQG